MNNQLRIIGGKWRGRKLNFPDAKGLRPSADRIRETLFNWLMHDIHHAKCLDAFAGSGALGFEALSRGCKEMVMLDSHSQVIQSLQANQQKLEANATIIKTDSIHYLQQCQQSFDIIFLDPPFHQGLLTTCLELIAKQNLLNAQGKVYIEYEANLELKLDHWQVLKQKTAGQVNFCLLGIV